jgi:hypothetical protein
MMCQLSNPIVSNGAEKSLRLLLSACLGAFVLAASMAPATLAADVRSLFTSRLLASRAETLPAAVLADHAFAMAMYRQFAALASPVRAAPPLIAEGSDLGPWLWVSADAAAVRRLEDGTFLITGPAPGGQFHRDLFCRVAQWPSLDCSDGSQMRMAAPTPERLLLGQVEYRRRPRP